MNDILLCDIAEGIATVTLNRPDKKNALSMDLFEALPKMARDLGVEKGLRAVILTGAGSDFCAGLDLAAMQGFASRMDDIRHQMLNPPEGQAANFFQAPVTGWAELNVPVIAAISGVCLGGGMQLALGADFRIAAPGSRFSIMEAKWGMIPDMGITQSLPKLMRADQAKDLIMTARMFDADEALQLGLLTRIADDPLAAARDYAALLSIRSPDAIAGAKTLVDRTWTMAPNDGLTTEATLQAGIIGQPNQMAAVISGMTGQPAKFDT